MEKIMFKKITKGDKFPKASLFMDAQGRIKSNIILGEGTEAKEDGYYLPFEDLNLIPVEEARVNDLERIPREGGDDPSVLAKALEWVRSHFSVRGMRLDREYKDYLTKNGFCVEPIESL